MKVLLVHGDKKMVNALYPDFRTSCIEFQHTPNGREGLTMGVEEQFDLILLDLGLPVKNGLTALDVLKGLRQKNKLTPIMTLTAEHSVKNIIQALNSGAEMCVSSAPLENRVLIAKMNAMVRRRCLNRGEEITYGHLRIDPVLHKAWSANRLLDLTAKEYTLFRCFLENPEQVLSRETIVQKVWPGNTAKTSNIVDVYVNCLRKKIYDPYYPKVLHTVRLGGYMLKV